MNALHDAVFRAQFGLIDSLRRLQGRTVAVAFGLEPAECEFTTIASGSLWHLRDYGAADSSPSVLIVPAPIKRPYIWDLTPSVSAVRYCLRNGLHVYLLEWIPATHATSGYGIEAYTQAIGDCVAKVLEQNPGKRALIIGHSLGGTLAAIYAASSPKNIDCLVLLESPLCFRANDSPFRDAVAAIAPCEFSDEEPFAGSLLSNASLLASPGLFIWGRLMDASSSLVDPKAFDIYARIELWCLDEVALPGKLVRQIVEQLYRDNRLQNETLQVNGSSVGPSHLSVPTLAIVNAADEIAPLGSVKPFLDAMATKDVKLVEYPGEPRICFQHLGMLVGSRAFATVWPEIMSWVKAHVDEGYVERSRKDHLSTTVQG